MKAAAITAKLVDMRNVGTHKVLKLTIHVPEEEALKAIAAFGWPTGVAPVDVAIAQLDLSKVQQKETTRRTDDDNTTTAPEAAPREQRRFSDLSLPQRAGMLCNEPAFWTYLQEHYSERCRLLNEGTDSEKAALILRSLCMVKSRSELNEGDSSGRTFLHLESGYRLWMKFPELTA